MPGHVPHDYLSTACLHEAEDPGLHDACRLTCKFCDAPCRCPQHPGQAARQTEPWVTQARDMARRLLDAVTLAGADVLPDLMREIEADPALFWLRGEEQPPGTWRPPD